MNTVNLIQEEAREKMASMVNDIQIAMLITNIGSKPVSAVPMNTKKVDESGNIWFLSRLDSDHNLHIVQDPFVQLLYSNPSTMAFITIFGKAQVNIRQERLNELYSKSDNIWYCGLDDPNLTALKITPKEAFYWDTRKNSYISLFQAGIPAFSGAKEEKKSLNR